MAGGTATRSRSGRLPRLRRTLTPGRIGHTDAVPVVDHLEELRTRIIWCGLVVVGSAVAAFVWMDVLLRLLKAPLEGRYPLVTFGVTEPFFTQLTIAAHVALMVSLPVLLYHLYQYVAPALEAWQRRAAIPYLLAVPALFCGGVAFGYFLVLEPAIQFLLGLGAGSFDVQLRAREYYSFVTMTLLGMGLVFLYPLVLLLLGRLGVVTDRTLRSNRKIALIVIALVAALLPTADPVSLAIEIIPLLALYELSIWLVRMQQRVAPVPARDER